MAMMDSVGSRNAPTYFASASPTPVAGEALRARRAQPGVAEDVGQAQVAHPDVGADRVPLEDDRDAEDGHREHQERQRRRGVVPDRVLLDRGEDTHQHAEEQRQDRGGEHQLERHPERGHHLRLDRRERVALRDGDAPVAAEEVAEPGEVPGEDALVEAELVLGLGDRLRADPGFAPQLAERVAGVGHHDKTQEGADQQDRDRDDQPAEHVEHQVHPKPPVPAVPTGDGRGGDRNPVTPASCVQAFILR